MLRENGIEVAVITARQSKVVSKRMQELDIEYVFQGQKNKQNAFDELLRQLKLRTDEVAYMGDDLPDLKLIRQAGLGISVADGRSFVQEHADWVSEKNGGCGAVREACELLLLAQDKLQQSIERYL